MELSPVAARILGCLLEKERTTPDQYPLSLNALVTASNQTTNRDPVVRYDEATVETGLDELRECELVRREKPHGGRAIKYSQRLVAVIKGLGEPELAVVAVLLLRGAQTPGELKARTDRLHSFTDLVGVETALTRLVDHEDGPWVRQLPREPGRKESRWTELLSAPEAALGGDRPPRAAVAQVTDHPSLRERIEALEAEVVRLAGGLDGLVNRARD